MILDQSLDKLRNKELSFGLHFNLGHYDGVVISEGGEVRWKRGLKLEGLMRQVFLERAEIIGHPLTLGRIYKLGYDNFMATGSDIIYQMQCIMTDIQVMGLADKTEVGRMQHEKRPELRSLLIKFAEYF